MKVFVFMKIFVFMKLPSVAGLCNAELIMAVFASFIAILL